MPHTVGSSSTNSYWGLVKAIGAGALAVGGLVYGYTLYKRRYPKNAVEASSSGSVPGLDINSEDGEPDIEARPSVRSSADGAQADRGGQIITQSAGLIINDVSDLKEQMGHMRDLIEQVKDAYDNAKIQNEEIQSKIKSLLEESQTFNEKLEKIQGELKNNKESIESMQERLDHIATSLFTIKNNLSAVSVDVKSIKTDIIAIKQDTKETKKMQEDIQRKQDEILEKLNTIYSALKILCTLVTTGIATGTGLYIYKNR